MTAESNRRRRNARAAISQCCVFSTFFGGGGGLQKTRKRLALLPIMEGLSNCAGGRRRS